MSNLQRMRVYIDQHGPEPYARASVAEYAHIFTQALTGGRGVSPGTPVDKAEARGGWRIGKRPDRQRPAAAAFYGMLGAVEVDRFMLSWNPGDDVIWWNNVPHLIILAGGRRSSSTGKMIGSIQAPDGWIEQSDNETRAHMRGWHPSGRAKLQATAAFARGGF